MEPLSLPTEEEIRTATGQGEVAVVQFKSILLQIIALQAARSQSLKDQLAKNEGSALEALKMARCGSLCVPDFLPVLAGKGWADKNP